MTNAKPLKPSTGTGRPQTPAQQAASHHNFAVFQLKGWRNNLQFVKGQVSEKCYSDLEAAINSCLSELKKENSEVLKSHGATTLEQWALGGGPGRYSLHGKVYGHPNPKFEDADHVSTSRVVSYDAESKIAVTSTGTRYHLGQPHPSCGGLVLIEAVRLNPQLKEQK